MARNLIKGNTTVPNLSLIYKSLCKRLGYIFNNFELLNRALRHRSMGKDSNERLEFLGDAVLNFIIAAELFHRYPNIREGELSRLRANLVNGETLAELAGELHLGKDLQFGSGELQSNGAGHKSILADAMEAVIGAMYLDGGIINTQSCVLNWFTLRLDETTGIGKKDSKTRLQELLQLHKLSLPIYTIVNTTGAAHERIFTVTCEVTEVDMITTGIGSNKRFAEREAAEMMLIKLESYSGCFN
ncbi:MAG: ribonuclease III [Coxiellaceae bacterium]|nr:ribonuclease III [Coxiellaceae bacterium]